MGLSDGFGYRPLVNLLGVVGGTVRAPSRTWFMFGFLFGQVARLGVFMGNNDIVKHAATVNYRGPC